jgi:hypothetical protein
MHAIITVFKTELMSKPSLINTIKDLSSDLSEVADAYSFSPKSGRLFELLNFLRENNINYGTHFDIIDDVPSPPKQ